MYNQYEKSIQAPIDTNRFRTVNQKHPAFTVSNKYRLIPTKEVLDILHDFGWFPVKVDEARTRIEEKKGYQKHAIRLCNSKINEALEVGSTIPQLLLTNSHSGTASFSIDIALLEKVCMNGLLVARHTNNVARVAHRGYTEEKVARALEIVVSEIPSTLEKVEEYKGIELEPKDRQSYAQAAIELRFDGEKYAIQEKELLFARRSAQKKPTLWNTYNVVQEALIQGGVGQRRSDGSTIRSRAVKSIDENIRLNKSLWSMTENMAKLMTGRTAE